MFISSSYHFLHLTDHDAFDSCAFLHALPSTLCMYINYRRIFYNTYVLYTSLHSPSAVTFVRPCFINIQGTEIHITTSFRLKCTIPGYHTHLQKLAFILCSLDIPLSFDRHVFPSQKVCCKSVIPCNSTYI